jgi:hypothetical protein
MLEVCSCEMLCPCWLGPARPDQGWCSGALIYHVEQGTSDGIDLSGNTVAWVADWPGDFWEGNGTARLYLDEAATANQRRELEAICSGRKGGPLEPVWGAVITTWLPTETVKIAFDWTGSPAGTVGTVGEVKTQRVTDQAGQQTRVTGAAAMAAFRSESMDLVRSNGSRWADPGLRQWTAGGSGTLHTLNWSA